MRCAPPAPSLCAARADARPWSAAAARIYYDVT